MLSLSTYVRNASVHLMVVGVAIALAYSGWNCKSTTAPIVDPAASDVTLAVPAATDGFQVQVGPFNVLTGTEVQKDYYLKLPNATDVWVTKVVFRFNAGSHHLNVFKNDDSTYADQVIDDFNAIDFAHWRMVASSQRDSLVWEMPNGCAFLLKAHQQMMFQTHYVNAGTQATVTGRGLCLVNFITTPGNAAPANIVGCVFSQNTSIDLKPHTSSTWLKVVKLLPGNSKILLMTGHYHSRGKSFVVTHWKDGKATDTLYKNITWDDPPVNIYNPALNIAVGDSIAYITTYENPTDTEILFGGHVETQEHSNLFTYYYPAAPGKYSDFDKGANAGQPIETHIIP